MADLMDCEIELTVKHVPLLVEHLSRDASMWRELGTALEFRKGDLDNIQACLPLLSNSPYSFMQRLVEEWVEGKYPYIALPTLSNLLKALKSWTVGLGKLAIEIKASLSRCTESNLSSKYAAKVLKIGSLSSQKKTGSYRKSVAVNENMHVHLKVETTDFLCAWSNTGLVPITDKLYSHTEKPVLCISEADIDMDGSRHSCRVAKQKQSVSTILRVNCPQLDRHKRHLASIYLAQPEVPQDSWPPVINKTYINLALIKQQKINYGGEYAHLTVRGDIDDILHHKEKIEYENIFDGLGSGSLLLIEGRPGSGKTTFVHKITRDWAVNEVRGSMRLVLLVSLRVLNSWEKPVTLDDILQLLKMQVSATDLIERNGKGVCFIFDGLDEFSPDGRTSIIYEIINKKFLPQSIVIVASRPAALVTLRQRADKVIEVIGFPRDQVFEFIKNYPFSDTLKADQLKPYLLSHPNILHMCYLPIHAAMVAFLFEVMGKVPRTETEIYKHFTRFTLIRSLSKHKEQDELEDMDTNEILSGEEIKLFNVICERALEITKLNKQVLDQDKKMKQLLQSKDIKGISLGLVTVDRTAGLYGFKNIYTFLHLTYQEYLAAHYISTLSDEDQCKLIQQYGGKDHMQVVWKFYFGLINFKGHENKIKALLSGRNETSLLDIQCAYESQQEVVCNCIMQTMHARIILGDKYLTTTDFTALGYLLANSSMPASLSLIKCNFSAESAKTMVAEIEGKPLSLHALHCELIKADHLYLDFIRSLLALQDSIEHLKIIAHTFSHTSLDDYDFSTIVSTSLKNLEELSLKNVQLGPKALSKVLQFCEELTSLILNYNINELDDIEPLLAGILECKKLETEVSCNFTSATNEFNLHSSDITINAINHGKYTSTLFVQGVRGKYLQTLRLSENLMSSSKYWPPKPQLLIIIAGSNDIIPVMAECISDFSALEKLMLSNMVINATFLANNIISRCVMLRELHLRGCGIEEEGAEAIADCIKYCPELTEVDLSENNISNTTLQKIKSDLLSRKRVTESRSRLHNEITEFCSCCTLL